MLQRDLNPDPSAHAGLGASVSATLPFLAMLVSATQGVPLSTAMQGLSSLASGSGGLPGLSGVAGSLPLLQPGQISYSLEDFDVVGLGSVNGSVGMAAGGILGAGEVTGSGSGGFFVEEGEEGQGSLGAMWESVVERLL